MARAVTVVPVAQRVLTPTAHALPQAPVRRVRLRVGRRQAVVPDVLEFCWRMVAQGTGAADADLELTEVPVRVRCRSCGAEGEVDGGTLACPGCGATRVEAVAGDELDVVEIELAGGEVRRNPALAAAAVEGP